MRDVRGGISQTVPQDASRAFAEAFVDVANFVSWSGAGCQVAQCAAFAGGPAILQNALREEAPMASSTAATVRAPEFPPDLEWFNSRPLSLADLRGKLVLLDFWTST
jgi:hypothetical protein